jgi:predicted transcriptional regulator of viral defense system
MKKALDLPILLKEMAPEMGYVFSKGDLAHLFGNRDNTTLDARMRKMIGAGYLKRAMRGYFFTEGAALEDLALKIYPEGYLSIGSALSYHQMIGTSPRWLCHMMTTRPKGKVIKTDIGTIAMSCHQAEQHFGIINVNGRRYANKEKALIDTCYFYLRGKKFPFNINSDIDISSLEPERLEEYLSCYKNSKFISFVRGLVKNYGRST